MKTRNILTTIASIATRAIIGGAIGYAVGTAIDRIRTNIALKKSIEDAANDPRVRRVHIDRINIDRAPVETIDLNDIPDYADPDELPSFSEILRNTRFVVVDCVTGCAEMIGDISCCEEWVNNHSDDPTVEYEIITEDEFLSL